MVGFIYELRRNWVFSTQSMIKVALGTFWKDVWGLRIWTATIFKVQSHTNGWGSKFSSDVHYEWPRRGDHVFNKKKLFKCLIWVEKTLRFSRKFFWKHAPTLNPEKSTSRSSQIFKRSRHWQRPEKSLQHKPKILIKLTFPVTK